MSLELRLHGGSGDVIRGVITPKPLTRVCVCVWALGVLAFQNPGASLLTGAGRKMKSRIRT